MTDTDLVLHKISRLVEQLRVLHARRPSNADVLTTDLILRDAIALALLVAIQESIDIAYHIVADEGWGVPDSHAAAFELLAANGVVTRELAQRLSSTARVRNRIAHGYAAVDHVRLWEDLPQGLDTLDAYARSVAAWLPMP